MNVVPDYFEEPWGYYVWILIPDSDLSTKRHIPHFFRKQTVCSQDNELVRLAYFRDLQKCQREATKGRLREGCREKKWAVGVKLDLGGQGENAEFFELRARTYQGFFETKKTLFLETRPGGSCWSWAEEEEKGSEQHNSFEVKAKRRLMVIHRACLRFGKWTWLKWKVRQMGWLRISPGCAGSVTSAGYGPHTEKKTPLRKFPFLLLTVQGFFLSSHQVKGRITPWTRHRSIPGHRPGNRPSNHNNLPVFELWEDTWVHRHKSNMQKPQSLRNWLDCCNHCTTELFSGKPEQFPVVLYPSL